VLRTQDKAARELAAAQLALDDARLEMERRRRLPPGGSPGGGSLNSSLRLSGSGLGW